jgi:hypothetical protein
MNTMVLLVLQNPELLNDILSAWRENGAKGVTVLPSVGMSHLSRRVALREDLPIMPGIDDLLESSADQNHTLFTIVEDDQIANKIIDATLAVTGSLDVPNTGIITAWHVTRVIGLNPCND